MPLNALLIFNGLRPEATWPPALAALYNAVAPFRIVNGYGLFRVMTKERPEIMIEGSANGIEWKPYEFKWKPGALDRMPAFVEPHQPRLDWQMWFAALGDVRQNPWFIGLALRLLENSPDVTALLGKNPFPGKAAALSAGATFIVTISAAAGSSMKPAPGGDAEDERVYLPVVSDTWCREGAAT